MPRLNINSTLRVEDYPSEYRAELLPRLFQSLNLFITQLVAIINGGVEFGVNIPSQDNALEFNFAGILPSYKWGLTRKPLFVMLGQAFEDSQPIALVFTWSYDSSRSQISFDSIFRVTATGITPLQDGSKYQIPVRTLS